MSITRTRMGYRANRKVGGRSVSTVHPTSGEAREAMKDADPPNTVNPWAPTGDDDGSMDLRADRAFFRNSGGVR
jgi:hypothetical protein